MNKQQEKELKAFCDEYVNYDPKTGLFTWKKDRGSKYKKGMKIGCECNTYWHVNLNGKTYKAHRIAFLIMEGNLPPKNMVVDHIDNNPLNNAWNNLRLTTHSQNNHNKSKHSNNTSGHTGVSWYKKSGKWRAQVNINGKLKHLGLFDNIEDAVKAREEAWNEYQQKVLSGEIIVKPKKKIPKPSDEELYEIIRERYTYNPKTGEFSLNYDFGPHKEGKIVGSVINTGYVLIGVKCNNAGYYSYQAHRLAFLWMTGSITKLIDHIDGDKTNNRWNNLREATHSQNRINTKATGKSGVKGVYWNKQKNKYQVIITINNKRKSFGYYTTLEEAKKVSEEVRAKHYGEFDRDE